jgi:hypothetical protein
MSEAAGQAPSRACVWRSCSRRGQATDVQRCPECGIPTEPIAGIPKQPWQPMPDNAADTQQGPSTAAGTPATGAGSSARESVSNEHKARSAAPSPAQVLALYRAIEPWGKQVGAPFRKHKGLEDARAVLISHFPGFADVRSVTNGAVQAMQKAANYGRNFTHTRCAEWLGFPHSERELRKQCRALGVSEKQFDDLYENIVLAMMYLQRYPDKDQNIVQIFERFDDDDTLNIATTLLVLRLRLVGLGKMSYPSF